MSIYETHCHLNHRHFVEDVDAVIERAIESNVQRLLVVSYDLSSSRRAVELALSHPKLFAAVGIHPEDLLDWNEETREILLSLAMSNPRKVIAWGEIGLDYHWKTFEPSQQKTVFVEQMTIARAASLPVIIHCRDAYDDTLDILSEIGASRTVIHCFTGTVDQAVRAVALGCYIGVGGVLTYKSAENVRDIVREIPLDRILLETDSPFLAPQPWRGKRNEPAHLTAITVKLAETIDKTRQEIEDVTFKNAETFFGQSNKQL